MDVSTVAGGLASNPLAWGLALALAAIAFLFRALMSAQKELTDTIKADAKEQREILQQIVPLATRLTETAELFERLLEKE